MDKHPSQLPPTHLSQLLHILTPSKHDFILINTCHSEKEAIYPTYGGNHSPSLLTLWSKMTEILSSDLALLVTSHGWHTSLLLIPRDLGLQADACFLWLNILHGAICLNTESLSPHPFRAHGARAPLSFLQLRPWKTSEKQLMALPLF